MGREEDRRVAPCGLLGELAFDIIGDIGEVGKGGDEESLDLGDGSAVDFTMGSQDVAD